jgi:NADH-quinone oxidoreductase subunit M
MLAILIFIIPLVFGLLYITNVGKSAFKTINVFGALAQTAILCFLIFTYSKNPLDTSLSFSYKWLSNYDLKFHLGLNGLSVVMIILTVLVIRFISFFSLNFNYKNKNQLLGYIYFTEAALLGLFMAKDIFVFYFFFELALVPVYLIANIWGGEKATGITFKMLIYTVFGSLFMLINFVLIYMRAQTADIDSLQATISLFPDSLKTQLFWGFILAFAIKMPIFPLHTWLPDVYSESPTPVSMLLSGLLSKMGVYGLIRILLALATDGAQEFGFFVIICAVIGLIYGSIIAIQQNHLKRLIAYSSFAHMGLMAAGVLTLSEAGMQGAILQMFAHGINAVGLFYIAKIIYDKTGQRDINSLGGLAKSAPKLAILFLIILLGSIALPLTNGFVGEFLLLKAVFDFNKWTGIIAGLSVVLGAVYMLRLFQKTMFQTSEKSDISDIETKDLYVLIPIAALVIIMGIWPSGLLNLSQSFVDSLSILNK